MSNTTTKDIIKYVLILVIIIAVFVMLWLGAAKIIQMIKQQDQEIKPLPSPIIDLTPYPTKDYQGEAKTVEDSIQDQEEKINLTQKEVDAIIQALQDLEKELEK